MLESGAKKGLLQGSAERQGGSYPKKPWAPQGFWQSIFTGQVKELGVTDCAQSFARGGVAGYCHRCSHHQSLGSRRPEAVCSWALSSHHLPFVGQGEVFNTCKTTQEMCIKNRLKKTTKRLLLLYTSVSRVPLFVTLWTAACQALPVIGFSRQESCSGLPFPAPGDLPNPRIEPALASSQILLSKHFREELKQRMWSRSVPGRPRRVLFSYVTTL